MAEPVVQVLGVHPIRVTDELIRDRMEYSWGVDSFTSPEDRIAAERESRELLESVVLIEALVHNRDEWFDAGDFTQRIKGVPRENWQVAYEEAYLTPDGASLAVDPSTGDVPSGDLRIAFFLHDWDSNKLLATSYDDVPCPVPTPMPERLEKLVPYFNVD